RGLEAGPGDVHVVLVLMRRIRTDGQPFLVTAIVYLDDCSGAPGVSTVSGLVYLNGTVARRSGCEISKIEDAMAVDAHRRIPECITGACSGRHESARPGRAGIVRYGKTGQLDTIDDQAGA